MTSAEQLEILALTHALIDAGWVKGTAHKGDRYCLLAAISLCATYHGKPDVGFVETVALLTTTLKESHGNAPSNWRLDFWNNAPTRCKRDVLRLLEQAAAKVGKG